MLFLRDIRWIFFDLGNTLINEYPARRKYIAELKASLRNRGFYLNCVGIEQRVMAEVRAFSSDPWFAFLVKLTGNIGTAHSILDKVFYPKDAERPYSRCKVVLNNLAGRGFMLGVIANQSQGTKQRLRNYGLEAFFSVILCSAETGISKPDLEIFRLAETNAGCPPAQILFVGDRIDNDIRPARKLAWRTIRIKRGLARQQIPRDSLDVADITIPTIDSLLKLI